MRHWLTLTIAVACAVILLKLVFEDWLHMPFATGVERLLTEPGPAAAALVIGLLSIDLFLPVPSSLVMILSGVLFGVWRGALLALAGSLIGNWAGFELRQAVRAGDGAAAGRRGAARADGPCLRASRRGRDSHDAPGAGPDGDPERGGGPVGHAAGDVPRRFSRGTIPTVFAYSYAGALSIAVGSVFPAVLGLMIVVGVGWTLARARLRPTARSSSFSASRD